jgi:2-oxoglutarate dehydrogenase complex dehydrogenase (E1) component-like enzyme
LGPFGTVRLQCVGILVVARVGGTVRSSWEAIKRLLLSNSLIAQKCDATASLFRGYGGNDIEFFYKGAGPWRKPLVVFTPKSMLRHPDASSTIEDLTQPRFLPVVPDREVTDAKRILIASGKVGHDLKAERRKRKGSNTAILFLDQLYPLPRPEISAAFAAHPNAREVVWVQEEPRNMGPFFYVMPRITQLAQERGLVLRSVKRSSSASPATGSAKAHELEQKTLVSLAFITSSAS